MYLRPHACEGTERQLEAPCKPTQCRLQGLLVCFLSYPQTSVVPRYRVPVTGAGRPRCGEQTGRGGQGEGEGCADGGVRNRPWRARSPERHRALRESPPAPPLRGVSRAPGHGTRPAASTPGGALPERPAFASPSREQRLPALPGPACPAAPQGQWHEAAGERSATGNGSS